MKKKISILAILICVLSFCVTALAVTAVTKANAEGETYTVSFETPMSGDYDMASSPETWTRYNAPVANDEGGVTMRRDSAATGTINYAAGVGKYTVETEKTYVIKFSIKSESIHFLFAVETPEWKTLVGEWVRSPSAYVDFSYEYTPTKAGSGSFIFQLDAGSGDVFIKDFKVYEKTDVEVTNGEAIGELPSIPEKKGYVGVWTIDGEEITADTVLAENKTAVVVYRKANTLTILPVEYNYDIAASTESWTTYNTPVANEDGGVTLTRDASASGNVNYGAGVGKYTVTAGKTYVAEISVKTDNDIRFVLSSETPNWGWKIIPDKGIVNIPDYVVYKSEFTATASGSMRFIFQLVAGEGNIYVKNFRVYEKIEKQFTDEVAIGELPAIAAVEGYTEGYWAIDGEKITADTVYNYGTDKTAYVVQKKINKISFVNDDYDYDMAKDLESWKVYNVPVAGEDGGVVLNRPEGLDSGTAHNYLGGVDKLTVTEGKTYVLSFDMKCDNIHMIIALNSPKWVRLGADWFNNTQYVHYEYEYAATESGAATVIFQTDAGSGNLYVKNIKFYEVEKKTVIDGDTYGELPSLENLTAKHGYRLCWTVDGEEITADTVCNYTQDKIARLTEVALDPAHVIEKVDAKAATCDEDGYKEYYHCTTCDKYFTDVDGYNEIADIAAWKNGDGKVSATGHAPASEWTTDGEKHWHVCTVCGKKVDEAAHIASENWTTDSEKHWKVCTVCGEKVDEAAHIASENWTNDDDKHWHVCSVCNEKLDEAAHSWNDGEITTAATCKQEGVKTYACTVCGETKTETVAKTAHTPSSEWTNDEDKHWHVCSVCNEKLDEAAHSWNDGEITTAATCKQEGIKTYICTVCEKTKTEAVEKTAHTPSSEWTNDEDKHWHVCTVCNEKLDEAAHADENKDGKCDVCEAEVKGDTPDVPEESDKPGESEKPEESKTSEITGGCFAGMNGALGMISLIFAAGAAAIIAKRGRKE